LVFQKKSVRVQPNARCHGIIVRTKGEKMQSIGFSSAWQIQRRFCSQQKVAQKKIIQDWKACSGWSNLSKLVCLLLASIGIHGENVT